MKKWYVELCGGPGDGGWRGFDVSRDDLPDTIVIPIQPPAKAKFIGPNDICPLPPHYGQAPEYGHATYRLKYLPKLHYEYDGES